MKKHKKSLILIVIVSTMVLLSTMRYLSNNKTIKDGIGIYKYNNNKDRGMETIIDVPYFNFAESPYFQIDLSNTDLRSCNLHDKYDSLVLSNFNSNTIWSDNLPENFNPKEILEVNKNPGLNIKSLHNKGIDGRGVAVGIIDSSLYYNHSEYKDNLKHYEEINPIYDEATYHASAMSSLLVGKNIGVAPGSDLYFVYAPGYEKEDPDSRTLKYIAQGINRLLDINKNLPEKGKIKAISISYSCSENLDGYSEYKEAFDRAKSENVFIVTTGRSFYRDYGIKFQGLIRKDPTTDPDDINMYTTSIFSGGDNANIENDIFIPQGNKTVASYTGKYDYAYDPLGGLSSFPPYIAGLYVLCAQINSSITPEIFCRTLKKSVDITAIKINGNIDYTNYPEIRYRDSNLFSLGDSKVFDILNNKETIDIKTLNPSKLIYMISKPQ